MTNRLCELRSASVFGRFCENSTTVQRVIDDLAYGGCFWIYIHPVARFQMSNNSLGRDLKRNSYQLRIATRLDVIDSQEPFIQRQVCIKSHDYVKSSNQNFRIKWL
jgi:hypothetical protein